MRCAQAGAERPDYATTIARMQEEHNDCAAVELVERQLRAQVRIVPMVHLCVNQLEMMPRVRH